MLILLIIISCILVIMSILYVQAKRYNIQIDLDTANKNEEIQKKNKELSDINYDLSSKNEILKTRQEDLKCEQASLSAKIDRLKVELDNTISTQEKIRKSQEETSRTAFENFCDVLDKSYEEKSSEYDELIKKMQDGYAAKQGQYISEIEEVQKELDKIKATRTAAIEAQVREKQIKADMSFYCLIPSRKDLQDYDKINSLRPMLNNDRALSMLLWQTYYQPLAKKQFPLILGSKVITGIYKITNQVTDQCYIGQAIDMDKRWKDHCKCGLGIDTPVNNKLYKSMNEYGLHNFSFELLEECEKNDLDEKEKYYIDLYDSYNYGYNATRGNGGK